MATITYLNVCLPDYFQGSGDYVVCTPVTNETTREELALQLEHAYTTDLDYPFDDVDFLEWLIKGGAPKEGALFPDLPDIGEDDECSYFYCSITE